MSQEFDIACPACNVVFSVPVELGGEMGECAECGSVFKIPVPPSAPAGLQLPKSDTGIIRGVSSPDNFAGEVTHTVKLSRTSIGMIPTLRDSFKFDAPSLGAQAPGAGARKPSLQRPPSAGAPPPPPIPTAAAPSRTAAPPPPLPVAAAPPPLPVAAPSPAASATQTRSRPIPVEVPDWTGIKLRRGEEAQGFQASVDNGVGMALLASAPALVAGAGALLGKKFMIVVAVAAVWLITFVVAIVIARSRGRRGLLVTNLRAIAIGGGKRIEVKK